MVDLFHLRVVGKVFHDLFGVLGMALHAQAQSLNTLQQQECVERADSSAGITQQDGTHIGYESSRAGSVHKADAVVAGVGCCNGGIVAGSSPVELAAVHDDAAQGGAMAADELGGGVNNDVCAVLQRADQVRGAEGVVDDKRNAVLVGDSGNGVNVGDVGVGVAKRFNIDSAGCLLYTSDAADE